MIYKMKNKIQNYKWGSANLLKDFFGFDNPNNELQAELWMGAHPRSSSEIEIYPGKYLTLDKYLKNKKNVNGLTSANKIAELPFLFKVLAVNNPLSIQVHPNKLQAKNGFKRENTEGIPLNAWNRSYKDCNHKPEIACALTDFFVMAGFRDVSCIVNNFSMLEVQYLMPSLENLEKDPFTGLGNFFSTLMRLEENEKKELLKRTIALCNNNKFLPEQQKWIKAFYKHYSNDIGILSPLFLNIYKLRPGEAIYIPSGLLHAYLSGLAIELMANSDNVIRCGLTPKYIDVQEFISIAKFNAEKPKILKAKKITSNESFYKTLANEFILSEIILKNDKYILEKSVDLAMEPSILFNVDGRIRVEDVESGTKIDLNYGESLFADDNCKIILSGKGKIYRASVPAK